MTLLLHVILIVLLSYLGIELLFYWGPLFAALQPRQKVVPVVPPGRQPPLFCILVACRDGSACIEALVNNFSLQDYPADRYRLFLVADNCTDDSAAVARSLGMQVYERHDLKTSGKGNAVNEILTQRLKSEPFDILVIMDIDARVEPLFLQRAARYFPDAKPRALSSATFAKNPEETLLTHVGTVIQGLLRLHQEGRQALHLDAGLYGSHGYLLSRSALDELGWQTTTGLIAEDMELRLRCTLHHIPLGYASDLAVFNDVTADASAVHEQRKRWNSTYLPLIPRYAGPLLAQTFRGRAEALDALLGALLLPAFANLFIFLSFLTLVLGLLCWHLPMLRPYALASEMLWLADILYFMVAFSALGVHLGPRELKGFGMHLAIRAWALVVSVFFLHQKDWAPAPHKEDSWPKP